MRAGMADAETTEWASTQRLPRCEDPARVSPDLLPLPRRRQRPASVSERIRLGELLVRAAFLTAACPRPVRLEQIPTQPFKNRAGRVVIVARRGPGFFHRRGERRCRTKRTPMR